MTSEEIKELMHKEAPVIYNGLEYTRISAYIYRVGVDARNKRNHPFLQCELYDAKTHSVVIVEPDKIKPKG